MHKSITALQQMPGNTVRKFPGPENVPGLAHREMGPCAPLQADFASTRASFTAGFH